MRLEVEGLTYRYSARGARGGIGARAGFGTWGARGALGGERRRAGDSGSHRAGEPTELGGEIFGGLNHIFEPGTQTVITGPSGSGKSTLLYLLALLLTSHVGRISWGGKDVSSLDDAERSRLRATHAGFVFQDAVLDPARTTADNVMEAAALAGMPKNDAQSRTRELLASMGLSDRANHRPGEVSGGQAQRVALCRALVKRPSVIFADEPTGNLDADNADIVWRTLADAAEDGATVIIATHDHDRVSSASELVRLP